jgi:hypothetical protein
MVSQSLERECSVVEIMQHECASFAKVLYQGSLASKSPAAALMQVSAVHANEFIGCIAYVAIPAQKAETPALARLPDD